MQAGRVRFTHRATVHGVHPTKLLVNDYSGAHKPVGCVSRTVQRCTECTLRNLTVLPARTTLSQDREGVPCAPSLPADANTSYQSVA